MIIRVGLVPLVRPMFRGARMDLVGINRQALTELTTHLGFEIAYAASPVGDPDEARARAAEIAARFHDGLLDFVLILHVTFATGDLVAPILEQPVPVGIWALPEVTTTGPLPQNALCGLNMSLSLPVARQVPVKWFYGSANDPAFVRRLAVTLQALRGWKAIHEARLLWIGGTAPGFFRLEALPDLPLHVDQVPLEELFHALKQISNEEVSARLATVDEPSTVSAKELRSTMRIELALEHLARGYSGVALRCWPELPDRTGSMACAAFARLGDKGIPMACEGDVAGLASMLAVAAVTGHPAVLLDLTHIKGDRIMFWHCGNAPRVWTAGETRLIPHFNRGLPAVRDMRLVPGPACGIRFLERGRAAVYAGSVLQSGNGYDGVSGWIGSLRWASVPTTASGFLASVLNYRLPHHFAWGLGDAEGTLLELCTWLGHEVLRLDPQATVLERFERVP